ncbi:28151_t:CDS:2 [Dentiscutata erythropus]|uniref:28151_t:CDS:1 n=1 Tax=Dentiscutata erythropus TaxID=1348616 RepID=A0A9N9CW25_9GLOM|nr:28151_t:CDS:2 [Dentiscutata erythropus]
MVDNLDKIETDNTDITSDNLEYYHNSDYETTYINWEQDNLSESSSTLSHLLATTETLPSTLENKGKEKESTGSKSRRQYKCKIPSFT